MDDNTPRLDVSAMDLSDEAIVAAIHARYSGRMDTLQLTDPDTRGQLALDLGTLLGLCARLLDGRPR